MQDMPCHDEVTDALSTIRKAYARLEANNARLLEAMKSALVYNNNWREVIERAIAAEEKGTGK